MEKYNSLCNSLQVDNSREVKLHYQKSMLEVGPQIDPNTILRAKLQEAFDKDLKEIRVFHSDADFRAKLKKIQTSVL